MKFRRQYDTKAQAALREANRYVETQPSLTKAEFARDADLNELVRRFGISTGNIPVAALDPSYYGDLSDVPDLRTALDRVGEAKERFQALPAAIRQRFNHSPGQFYDWIHNAENWQEAQGMGLLTIKSSSPEDKTAPTPTPPST